MLPMNGDNVDRQRVEAVEVGARGREAVWDMSHAVVVEDGCTMRFFNSGDSVVARVDGQVLYSAPVVTNGNSYSYDVNLLPENYYVITITSVDDGYIGVLETEAE